MAGKFILKLFISLVIIFTSLVWVVLNTEATEGQDIGSYGKQMLSYNIPIFIMQLVVLRFLWKSFIRQLSSVYKWVLTPFIILYALLECFILGISWAEYNVPNGGEVSGLFTIFLGVPVCTLILSGTLLWYFWKKR